jgi:MFS family permease
VATTDAQAEPERGQKAVKGSLPVFQLLNDRNYRLFWPAGTGLQMGRWMWTLVSGYAVLLMTDSVFQTALVGVAFTAPMFFGGLLSGIVADAFNRQYIIMGVLVTNALLASLAALLVFSGLIEQWHILAFSLLIGASHALDQVARRTFVADLVARESLHSAFALDQMSHTVGVMLGPLLAGVILEIAPDAGFKNVGWSYLAVTTLYLGALAVVAFIRPPRKQALVSVHIDSLFRVTTEGIRTMIGSRALIGVIGVTVFLNLAFPSHRTLIPVFAQDVLLVGPTAMGALGAAQGIGSIIGSAFIASRRNIRLKSRYYYIGAMIGMSFLTLFGLSTSYFLSFLMLVAAGVGMSGFGSMQATMVLVSIDEKIRGRVMGVMSMFIGVMPLGTLMLGGLAEWLGPGQAVAVTAASGVLLTGVWSYFSREMRKV